MGDCDVLCLIVGEFVGVCGCFVGEFYLIKCVYCFFLVFVFGDCLVSGVSGVGKVKFVVNDIG